MNRTEKEAAVNQLKEGIGQSQALALLSFSGLDVEKMTAFRLSLRKQKVSVKVLKNTLASRVLAEGPYKDLVPQLQGQTLVAYGSGDPVLATKAICEWLGKDGFEFKVKGAAALGKTISVEQLTALSKLPGRQSLLVSFLWGLKMPPTKFLYALSETPKKLGYALAALRSKKEKESS